MIFRRSSARKFPRTKAVSRSVPVPLKRDVVVPPLVSLDTRKAFLTLVSAIVQAKMKYCLFVSALAGASAFAPAQIGSSKSALSESKADLEALATKLNPTLKFYDPLVSIRCKSAICFLLEVC
jgi:hypothetical protein